METEMNNLQAVSLKWGMCEGNVWCNFKKLNLNSPALNQDGVYMIWHSGPNPHVVRVGQGNIQSRLKEHRENFDILFYGTQGRDLYVTWAPVSTTYRDGVERYLAETWEPWVGERFPNVTPIRCNSPW
jgi:hypothetical protein